MFGSRYNDVLNIIKDWKPEDTYSNENGFRDDLCSFLRDELKGSGNSLMGSGGKRVSVKKESGRGLCDIAIDESVGIELKKDLRKKAQVDRLTGQIIRYKKAYDHIIIVLVGDGYPDADEDLRDMIEDLSDNRGSGLGLNQGVSIEVMDKTGKEEDEEDDRGNRNIFDKGNVFGF